MKRRAGTGGGGDFLKNLVNKNKEKTRQAQEELRKDGTHLQQRGTDAAGEDGEEPETITTWQTMADKERAEKERLASERLELERQKIASSNARLSKLTEFYQERQTEEQQLAAIAPVGSSPVPSPTFAAQSVYFAGKSPPLRALNEQSADGRARGSSSPRRHGSPRSGDSPKRESAEDVITAIPPRPLAEIMRRLRSCGVPITLFGEWPIERYRRMRKIEREGRGRGEDRGKGQINAFQREMRELELMDAARGSPASPFSGGSDSEEGPIVGGEKDPGRGGAASSQVDPISGVPIGSTWDDAGQGKPAKARRLDDGSPAKAPGTPDDDEDEEGEVAAAEEVPEKRVRAWMKRYLQVWEDSVDPTDPETRMQVALFRSSKKDLQPLLKKLKKRDVEKVTLDLLCDMITFCEKRQYRLGFEKYIELTVGNAAWPVGVTSVGIHERVGRSKLSEKTRSHVSNPLNDETTRKYMQVFKRLMKQCQTVNPPDDGGMRLM